VDEIFIEYEKEMSELEKYHCLNCSHFKKEHPATPLDKNGVARHCKFCICEKTYSEGF